MSQKNAFNQTVNKKRTYYTEKKKDFGIIDYVDKMKIATTANSGFALCGQFGSFTVLS